MDLVGLLVTLIVGGIIGWVASLIMGTDGQQGIFLNIIVGIVGSVLAKFIFADMLNLGGSNAGAFSIGGILWGIVGAVILLGLLKVLKIMK